MPINMQIEYPKLQAENIHLSTKIEELEKENERLKGLAEELHRDYYEAKYRLLDIRVTSVQTKGAWQNFCTENNIK